MRSGPWAYLIKIETLLTIYRGKKSQTYYMFTNELYKWVILILYLISLIALPRVNFAWFLNTKVICVGL